MLAPAAPPPPPPKPPAREGRTAPKDAKMKVRDEVVEAGDFVDLSAMILDEEALVRDTRMKVADEEPTGDEEKDFQEMLARFKQGIDENIDEADFQSHYDRSEEHTSELQSPCNLVCRLLLEKKKNKY